MGRLPSLGFDYVRDFRDWFEVCELFPICSEPWRGRQKKLNSETDCALGDVPRSIFLGVCDILESRLPSWIFGGILFDRLPVGRLSAYSGKYNNSCLWASSPWLCTASVSFLRVRSVFGFLMGEILSTIKAISTFIASVFWAYRVSWPFSKVLIIRFGTLYPNRFTLVWFVGFFYCVAEPNVSIFLVLPYLLFLSSC